MEMIMEMRKHLKSGEATISSITEMVINIREMRRELDSLKYECDIAAVKILAESKQYSMLTPNYRRAYKLEMMNKR